MLSYENLIVHDRFDKSKTTRSLSEEFTSDKNRIVFSPPFRRLQQKAQVFSLETNAAVRSRLTHTLEVATIGITIAEKITEKLLEEKILSTTQILPFIKIVENACLIHDIGNPPFGHFAEEAIKKWFTEFWSEAFVKAIIVKKEAQESFLKTINTSEEELSQISIIRSLICDFTNFDGNPQAIRIATKLQDIPGEYKDIGMNLTYSQIASIMKYIATPNTIDKSKPLYKKAGYFFSEEEKIQEIRTKLKISGRYPLTYIMEAADDISYCLSDIEDGIEKEIFPASYFFEKILHEYGQVCETAKHKYLTLIKSKIENNQDFKKDFFLFKIDIIRDLEKHSINRYIEKHSEILAGTLPELIDKNSDEGKMLSCLKILARKYLFRSKEAENKELVGYHAIYGLLDKYKCLLELEHSKFVDLITSKENINKVLGSGMDLQWRLFNRLPEKYVKCYKYEYDKLREKVTANSLSEEDFLQWEWFHRAHLIVDYISGMTDNFVLETYNLLYGIKVQ